MAAPVVELPEPFASIPRVALIFPHPPPIEPLKRLTQHLHSSNSDVKLYVKREDCNSGLAGGGNKVRKLEYVLADAVANKADTLVTEGGIQSNHMRQTAAAAAKLGLKTVLLPKDVVPRSQPEYRSLGNVQLTHLLGASHDDPRAADNDDADARDTVLTSLTLQGHTPYFIPSGASTHPLGGLGYARWAWEVAQQQRELGLAFDTIVVPLMSGSTLGGMVAGFKLVQEKWQEPGATPGAFKAKLIGVAAGPKPVEELKALVLSIARTAAVKIGLQESDITGDEFEIDGRWSAGQYGKLDDRTAESIKLVAGLEGMVTDPVYSGKALTGMIEMVKAGELKGNVLFVHTGGMPTISAYPELR